MRADVDLEPFGDVDDGGERARGDQHQRRQRRPFRMPGTGAALMVLHLRGKDRRGEIGRHGRGAERACGGDRVALVRHGRGAAAAFARGLEGFADIGLHHQRDVARDLAAGAGEDRKHRRRFRDAVAMGVPGRFGQRQLELARQRFATRQAPCRRARRACRRRRRIAAPASRAQSRQPQLRAMQRRGIFRELQPERHRQRVLQPGARDDRGVAMVPRERGKALDGAIEVGEQRVDAGAQASAWSRCRSRPGWSRPNAHSARPPHRALATSAVSALTRGIARLPERVAASASSARSNVRPCRPSRSARPRRSGITPAAASARASAASKSSMCWSVAASSQTARMAALDSIGASRGERAVLMVRAT